MRAHRVMASFALAASVAIGIGCAGDQEWISVLTAPTALPGTDGEERAYDLGHHYGREDDRREKPADYARHHERYAPEDERAFAMGYRDGFIGRSNRDGFGNERGFYQDR